MDIEALVKKHAGHHYDAEADIRAALTEFASEYDRIPQERVNDGERFKCEAAKVLRLEAEHSYRFSTEEFGFAQEMAMQYGASPIDDEAEIFVISAKDLYVLMCTLGYGSHPLEQERVPEGYVLVQQSIHPLDCVDGDKVMQLLANAPDAGPFDNPQDFYQFWWQQLLLAAAPAQEKV